jgi:hypothetical protein
MLEIERQIFNENLRLTQIYCAEQLKNCDKNTASIFRSINPVMNGKKIFEFKITDYGFDPENRYSFSTEWTQDPIRDKSSNLFNELFDLQLLKKREKIELIVSNEKFYGKILVAEIDATVTDGASEVSSDGLIDIYDCPPIDTWFHLTHEPPGRLLYAWIPREFVYQADEAIKVNCVDCIQWFEITKSSSEEYDNVNTLYQNNPKKSLTEKLRNFFK